VVVYRTRVHHPSPKNYQLDLFSPDDGYFEYSAVATNLTLTPRALWYFTAGRDAQEKTIAELKGEFALELVPTNHYGANSAWLQLCVLAHNLMRSFQLPLSLATPKPSSWKPTYSYHNRNAKIRRHVSRCTCRSRGHAFERWFDPVAIVIAYDGHRNMISQSIGQFDVTERARRLLD
jgi:hypothetical protein